MVKRRLVPRDERATVNAEFSSIEEFVSEYVTNVSRSGVFIKSKNPLPVGTKVNLKFTIFLDDPETIEGIGEVVRVSQRPKGMGVVFISLSPVSQSVIFRLLARKDAELEAAPTAVHQRARTQTKPRGVPPPPPKKKS